MNLLGSGETVILYSRWHLEGSGANFYGNPQHNNEIEVQATNAARTRKNKKVILCRKFIKQMRFFASSGFVAIIGSPNYLLPTVAISGGGMS